MFNFTRPPPPQPLPPPPLPSTEELEKIPKSLLIKYFAEQLHLWESQLPQCLLKDPDIRQHLICTEHHHLLNSNPEETQLDLAYFIRRSCPWCKNPTDQQKMNITTASDSDNIMEIDSSEDSPPRSPAACINCKCGKIENMVNLAPCSCL
ncbi:hypothetical protein O0L34_g19194 [Tuta absoluta]|nr:hypothetical protein O0L34_g19194 [Tuta absoluta]